MKPLALVSCIVALALALLAPPATALDDKAASLAALDNTITPLIESLLVEDDIPGLQIAVVANGELAWSRAFGFADFENGKPVTTDTVFRAASVSKLFTATLFMQQVDAGRIGLDDDVNESLDPEYRFRDANGETVAVTPRQLLSHTSGLPVTWLTWRHVRAFALGAPQPTIDELLLYPTLAHPPGERIVYANSGYWMLGWLAARLAGENFATLAEKQLLAPLGMTSSSFLPEPALVGRQAVPSGGSHGAYQPVPGPRALEVNPAASLLTTAQDLTHFARMILQGGSYDGKRVLGAGLVEEMQRMQARQNPLLQTGYGLGFAVSDFRGRRLIAHDGYDPGVSSRLVLLPDEGAAVAILVNATRSASVARIAVETLRVLTGLDDWVPEARPIDEEVRDWLGRYRVIAAMPPWLSWLERFSQLSLELNGHELRLRGPVAFGFQTEVDGQLDPTTTKGIYRFRGAPWNGHRVVLRKGDGGVPRIYVDILEMRKVPFYAATPVVVTVLGVALMAFVGFVVRGMVRRARRLRPRRRPRGRCR